MKRFVFDNQNDFVDKLRGLIEQKIPLKNIKTLSPYPVHKAEELMDSKPSGVRGFALFGAIFGLTAGFAFTIYTVKAWHLMSSAKPLVSIPAFLIIAFALTILFGALSSFAGFLLAARLPAISTIFSTDEFTNEFVIIIKEDE